MLPTAMYSNFYGSIQLIKYTTQRKTLAYILMRKRVALKNTFNRISVYHSVRFCILNVVYVKGGRDLILLNEKKLFLCHKYHQVTATCTRRPKSTKKIRQSVEPLFSLDIWCSNQIIKATIPNIVLSEIFSLIPKYFLQESLAAKTTAGGLAKILCIPEEYRCYQDQVVSRKFTREH